MDSTVYRYAVIGGGLAAASAVQGIRNIDPEGSLVIICEESRLPYHRPPLTKGLLLGKKKPEDIYCKKGTFYQENKIEVLKGTAATGLNPATRFITLSDGRAISYERALLATGSRARRLNLPRAELMGVTTIRTLDDALGLLSAMKEVRQAVVIGGSFIGAESAAALAQNGIQTTMIFPEDRMLERLVDVDFGQFLLSLYQKHGVTIRSNTKPVRYKGSGRVEAVITDKGEEIRADLVILGVGAMLNNGLAREAGLTMSNDGGVCVDEFLRTSAERVFAAGDIAEYPDPTFKRRLRVEHWDTALRQGQTAGRNMAGAKEPYTSLPHYFSTLFDCGFSVWGDFTRWEKTIKSEEFGRSGSYICYLEGGYLSGILAFDPVQKEEEEAIEKLVKRRIQQAEIQALTKKDLGSFRERIG
jgi:NADPH-dependent 2,4-dienoyl-CoA reductase/sulfur reductase-like enzyme